MIEKDVDVDGKNVHVKVRKLTYGEMNNIFQRCTEVKVVGQATNISMNMFKLQHEITVASVSLSEGKVDDLPVTVGRELEDMALKENGMSGESFQ
jgi:hypothetical protein